MYDTTNPDWVPSLKMGYEPDHTPDQECYTRLQLRKKRKIDAAKDAADDDGLETGVACQTDMHLDMVDGTCQTDVDMFEVSRMEEELQRLKADNQRLQTEASEAKRQAERASFCVEPLRNDEQKLKFYTGKLPL